MKYATFKNAIDAARWQLQHRSDVVHTEKWQGIDISKAPEMATHEVRHFMMRVPMLTEDLSYHREQINPNLPWADDHFEERVCGYPINPGFQWAKWPWGNNAKKFLDAEGKFNHNYMERYWPKLAGMLGATNTAQEYAKRLVSMYGDDLYGHQNRGIEHAYGDALDVAKLLAREPLTRQAVMPVWFPEDTGVLHGERVPCSLTYHFMMRNNALDVSYTLRSCDFVRHFRDDIYLTLRLALWMIDQARRIDERWAQVRPGEFVMLISSLHMFRNDYVKEFGA